MKNFAALLLISMLGGILTLGSYKLFFEENHPLLQNQTFTTGKSGLLPVSYDANLYGTNVDFTAAAEKTVHAVVNVQNVAVFNKPNSIWEYYYYSQNNEKILQGVGSGVIISSDGYIITNNHVITGASEIQVTLNNNKNYTAEVIGTDVKADIALIKIDATDLDFLVFGNSNNIKLGEWVLAVGNPFNLTSTVTAGIVSAKARDINLNDSSPQSFIQTDAAINPGNSGGALVNINGELIGINSAITSQTGSYIGYSFAIPSNNARKIVEDIMEYGDVQQGILGIRGSDLNQAIAQQFDINTSQGVFVAAVDSESGASKAGIKIGDVIKQIDNIEIRKMSDLTGYINSKRPGETVIVSLFRKDKEREVEVKLTKYETFIIEPIGLEITNASEIDLKESKTKNGVKIVGTTKAEKQYQDLLGVIISKINGKKVFNIEDVKNIFNSKNKSEPLSVTFLNQEGEEQTFIWR
jgi:Do/DeqQ family serine protease